MGWVLLLISAVAIFLIGWYTGTAKVTGELAAGTICIVIGSMGLWFSKYDLFPHDFNFILSVIVLALGVIIAGGAIIRGRATEDIVFSAAVLVAILSAFFGMVLLVV